MSRKRLFTDLSSTVTLEAAEGIDFAGEPSIPAASSGCEAPPAQALA
jgi:hypothetical protein